MINGPCLNCTERYVGCHSTCEAYKKYRKELDELNEKVAAVKNREYCDIGRAYRIRNGKYYKK